MKRRSYKIGGFGGPTACGIGYYVYHIEEVPLPKQSRFMMMVNREKLLKMIDLEKETIVASLGRYVVQ